MIIPWLKLLVEFLGTFFFLYVILATGNAWLIGLALAIAIYLGGAISGGAFNPAVVIMLWKGNKMAGADVIPYIFAEVVGGLAALWLFRRTGKINL